MWSLERRVPDLGAGGTRLFASRLVGLFNAELSPGEVVRGTERRVGYFVTITVTYCTLSLSL